MNHNPGAFDGTDMAIGRCAVCGSNLYRRGPHGALDCLTAVRKELRATQLRIAALTLSEAALVQAIAKVVDS